MIFLKTVSAKNRHRPSHRPCGERDQPSPTRILPPAANNHHGAADGGGATRRFDPDDDSIVPVGARTFRCEIIARPRPIQSWSWKRHSCGWLFQSRDVRMRRDRDQDQILTWKKMKTLSSHILLIKYRARGHRRSKQNLATQTTNSHGGRQHQ